MSDIVKTVFSKYLNLALTFVGIAVNSIAVLYNRSLMPEKMYTYLLLFSCFNLFYSLILSVKYASLNYHWLF